MDSKSCAEFATEGGKTTEAVAGEFSPQADTDPHRLSDPDGVGHSETERCNEVSPDGTMLCDREPGHEGVHVNWRGAEWSAA